MDIRAKSHYTIPMAICSGLLEPHLYRNVEFWVSDYFLQMLETTFMHLSQSCTLYELIPARCSFCRFVQGLQPPPSLG